MKQLKSAGTLEFSVISEFLMSQRPRNKTNDQMTVKVVTLPPSNTPAPTDFQIKNNK